ncbi:MAG: nitrous oxide reductase family maturation protein NosD [Cyanobacteriota bacterium]
MSEIIKYILNLSLLTIFFLIIQNNPVEAKLIKVGQKEAIKSLKEAVKVSLDGDQILLKEGTYKEGNILINKKISITGENNPVLDGEYIHEIFTIKSDNVSIKNITFKNSGISNIKDLAAIKIYGSKNCLIENNKLFDTFFAIYLSDSEKCFIKNNKIAGKAKTESSSANAIHIWKSNNITIKNNDISGHRDGIYFEFVKDSIITNNISTNNIRYGLHFMFSDGNDYINNSFIKNGAGVAVMYTKNIKMLNNKFENNWGSASYGLLLKEISKSEIKDNFFNKNTVGIYMEGSNRIDFRNNNLINNGKALRIASSCDSNKFSYNNFIRNSFDITTNASNTSVTSNIFEKNYWDKYKGYDLNKDKIGDIPYRPVSIFSMIVEKIPHAIILLRSLLVDILDVSEKVMPVFIPKTIIDEKPLMVIRK